MKTKIEAHNFCFILKDLKLIDGYKFNKEVCRIKIKERKISFELIDNWGVVFPKDLNKTIEEEFLSDFKEVLNNLYNNLLDSKQEFSELIKELPGVDK